MKIINFGSLNIDTVYSVDHIVGAGETLSSNTCQKFCGGKGLNQSVALSKAGASVYHAGCVGNDSDILIEALERNGVNTELINKLVCESGHALIQIDKNGQNSIIVTPGANNAITPEYVSKVLSEFKDGDWVVLQNEINCIEDIINISFERKLKIFFNPSPIKQNLKTLPLDKVSCFIMNEIEGKALTDEVNPRKIIDVMKNKYPDASFVLTLGEKGSVYANKSLFQHYPIYKTDVVDTTAAGDTFAGYFIANSIDKNDWDKAMKTATLASSVTVSRKGAAVSIPTKNEVLELFGKVYKSNL